MDTRADRLGLGIALMLGFCLMAPVSDGLAKLIGDRMPLMQLVAWRFMVQALLAIPLFAQHGWSLGVDPRWLPRIAIRTALHIAGIAMIFYALRYMPLADAIAIAYVMPFFALFLGALFLGEPVGWRRIIACAVGFGGTLLVMQPSFQDVGWIAALPLAVALVFATFMLMTRALSKDVGPIAIQAWGGIIGTVALVPLLFLSVGQEIPEVSPIVPGEDLWGLLIAIGIVGTGAHVVLTFALRYAPTTVLAPIQYIEIPAAVLVGWLFFGDLPNGLASVGIAIVMGAGLYIIWREQQTARAARPAGPDKAAEGPPSGE